jgi:catechol 2,3-dioxygenase-like lactoylglutathione lyase family enzyme
VTTTAAAHAGVAQLAHVPLFTPRPDATLHFFKDLLGMQESAHTGQSGYLRAYGDHYHHTLKIIESAQPVSVTSRGPPPRARPCSDAPNVSRRTDKLTDGPKGTSGTDQLSACDPRRPPDGLF